MIMFDLTLPLTSLFRELLLEEKRYQQVLLRVLRQNRAINRRDKEVPWLDKHIQLLNYEALT